jgi:hypothetical protein
VIAGDRALDPFEGVLVVGAADGDDVDSHALNVGHLSEAPAPKAVRRLKQMLLLRPSHARERTGEGARAARTNFDDDDEVVLFRHDVELERS